ncbi:hypothetical protein FHX52_3461 [Humibacillus xanthopallidus]|uniref:Uncharacterized protein n=1 Tax=Humibacillus xanthopallidus TaxID=412689 RepID=A0A543PRN1_9MICO|nr:hypothetical protein [Humibacillus xanthopallidus]TQN46732.1 hypothetical protein FHX52_3461 [Humibacillus xanthopallidus]
MLPQFDPPGFLSDFNAQMLQQWSTAVSGWIDGNIAIVQAELAPGDQPQFYNESRTETPGEPLDQVIGWSGFPGTFRDRWGRQMALDLADNLMPLTQRMDGPGSYFVGELWGNIFYRPQDEYCEWRVTRDDQGRITRVTFTSEPPEYWQALHGDTLPDMSGTPRYPFAGDKQLLLELYREYVDPQVQLADLECQQDLVDHSDPANPQVIYPKGSYNPYNRWNTTGGIMHLTHPANSLSAEINLGALASVQRTANGRTVIDPEALISGAAYGGLNRCSDPTIGSTVNELAALGAFVTLRNPVGLAMHHLSLEGFRTPGGEPVDSSFFTVLRGQPEQGLIEHAVFAVPAGEGYTVSDLTIGGIPITHGGQIAEHIVVNIVGRAAGLGHFANTPVACAASSYQDDWQGNWLTYAQAGEAPSPVSRPAFAYPPATPGTAAPPVAPAPNTVRSLDELAARATPKPPSLLAGTHRHLTRNA